MSNEEGVYGFLKTVRQPALFILSNIGASLDLKVTSV